MLLPFEWVSCLTARLRGALKRVAAVSLACFSFVGAASAYDIAILDLEVQHNNPSEQNNGAYSYYPGDPVELELTYGNIDPDDPPTDPVGPVRINIWLSTDGDYDNPDNFLLDFFDIRYIPSVRFTSTFITTVAMPMNYTGTYFVLAEIVDPPGDDEEANNTLSVGAVAAAKIRILPASGITVSRISEAPGGAPANELSETPSLSFDGRFAVFQSDATTLVTGITAQVIGRTQVYLRDLQLNQLSMVSVRSGAAANGSSQAPAISGDGRYIVYHSDASNLVNGDTNLFTDIFLYDRFTAQTRRVSIPTSVSLGREANGNSYNPWISHDGEVIVYESEANNLVANDTNNTVDLFAYRVSTGATTRISVSASGAQANAPSYWPRVSADGRHVVFRSSATNLTTGGANGLSQILSKDLISGAVALISRGEGFSALPANAECYFPSVSSTGRFVTFTTPATNLVNLASPEPLPPVFARQVYRVDRDRDGNGVLDEAGGTQVELVSTNEPGDTIGNGFATEPVISYDGRFVAYRTRANNLQRSQITRSDGLVVSTSVFHENTFPSPPRLGIVGFSDRAPYEDVYIRDFRRALTGFNMLNGGAGYTTAPQVTITGGGSEAGGAIGRAVIDPVTGSVVRIDVISGGAGYRDEPISPITVTLTGGGGSGALAQAVVGRYSDRLSVNKFGYETSGVIGDPAIAASRGVAMSGDGRFVAYVSDANNVGSVVFDTSNREPLDNNGKRDVFLVDRRFLSLVETPQGSLPTVSLQVSTSNLTFGSTRPIAVTAFDAGDVDENLSPITGRIAALEVYADGVLLARSTPGTASADLYANYVAPLSSQVVTLYAVVVDGNGNRVFSESVLVQVVPASSLSPLSSLSVTPGVITLGQSTNLLAAVSDPDGPIAEVRFFANGVIVNTDTGAPYTYVFTPSAAREYRMIAVAVDLTGNEVASGEVVLTVRPPPGPNVDFIQPASAPAPASVGERVFIRVDATAGNPAATVAAVSILARVGSSTTTLGSANRIGTSNVYQFEWVPTASQVGDVDLLASAVDSLGIRSESGATRFQVRALTGSVPTGFFTNPLPTDGQDTVNVSTSETISYEVAAADLDGSVVAVEYFANGGFLGTGALNVDTQRWVLQASLGVAGSYTIDATVMDSSNNRRNLESISVVAASPAPIVTLVSPGSDTYITTVGVPVFLEATAVPVSPDSVISAVGFTASGQSVGVGTRVGSSSSFQATWIPLVAGSYTVGATATDDLGTTGTSTVRTVIVRPLIGAAPTAALATASGVTSFTYVSSTYLLVSAFDPDGSVAAVEFFVNGRSIGAGARLGSSGAWRSGIVDFRGSPAGTLPVAVSVRDNTGNVTVTQASLTLTASTTEPPTVPFVTVDPISPVLGQLTTLAVDALPGRNQTLSSVTFYGNGAAIATDALSPWTTAWTAGPDDFVDLYAVAVDTAGNSRVSAVTELNLTPGGSNLDPVNSNTDFVVALYADLLGVSPTNSELQTAVNGLNNGTLTRGDILESLRRSSGPAANLVSGFALYHLVTGRWDTNERIQQILAANTTLGVVSFVTLADGLFVSAEYINQYGPLPDLNLTAGPNQFANVKTVVTRVYQNGIGATPTDAQVVAAFTTYIAGTNPGNVQPLGLGLFANAFFNTGAYQDAIEAQAWTAWTISSFLRRAATDAEVAEFQGLTARQQVERLQADPVYRGRYPSIGQSARLSNLSTRGKVTGGEGALIAGFVVDGTAPKTLLVRAAGPQLQAQGVSEVLGKPVLSLYRSTGGSVELVASNAGWSTAENAGSLKRAFKVTGAQDFPMGSADSAVYVTLAPGVYTAVVQSGDGAVGNALVEVYEMYRFGARAVNLSSRANVGTGENVAIGGLVVTGQTAKSYLVRGLGPRLTDYGVTGALPSTRITLFRGQQQVAANAGWSTAGNATAISAAAGAVGAPSLTAGDSALLLTLQPGIYTVHLSGAAEQTGVGLLEVFEMP